MSFTQCCLCLQIIHSSFGFVLHLLFQVSINGIGQYILQLNEHCRQRAPIENFGQHPGYFKAVFLKPTRIIIVSIYKYTVHIMF